MAVFGMPMGMEWVIILVVVLLLFGPKQLPKLMKSFGKSAKALREGLEGKIDEEDEAKEGEPKKAKKPAAASEEDDEEEE
jgi:sec-independent protein translocase protein TatA